MSLVVTVSVTGDAEGREKYAFLWRCSCQGSVLLHVMKMVTSGRKLRHVIVHNINLHCLGNYSCLACCSDCHFDTALAVD